jgi:hypothetical protein
MPVILDSDSYDMWFDPGMQKVNAVFKLLKALRCMAHAVLSRKHADQPRGE